jgi:hypothetical protein
VLLGPAFAQEIEDLPPLVMGQLKTVPATCPEDVGAGWICGQYRGSFNRLKFDLEVELDLQDFEARPLEPWKLKQGRYGRSWNVREHKVTMLFDPATQVVMIRQGPLDKVEPPAEPQPDPGAAPGTDGGAR